MQSTWVQTEVSHNFCIPCTGTLLTTLSLLHSSQAVNCAVFITTIFPPTLATQTTHQSIRSQPISVSHIMQHNNIFFLYFNNKEKASY